MGDLDDFNAGFHDGYVNNPPDKTRGSVYASAHRNGVAAAKRDRELHNTDVRYDSGVIPPKGQVK